MELRSNKFQQLRLTLIVVTAIVAGYSFLERWAEERRMRTDYDDLVACEKLADQIRQLKLRKQHSLLSSKPADELNRKIDDWTNTAQIDSQNVVRIEPLEPRRIGDSQYLEQITELEVVGESLPKLIQFIQLAQASEDGLKLSSLRISLPRSTTTDVNETWNAELALTYLIYSPKVAKW